MGMESSASHTIEYVRPGSAAYDAGLEAGDVIVSINGHRLADIFDYHYYSDEEDPTLLIRDAQGLEHLVEIEKDEGEDLGVTFVNGLLDDYRSCSNACLFCFIDQNPPGMRKTIYFKDDDTRLSFLQGNYVTLTNMKEEEIDRLIAYRMEPINVSVQATEPLLREKMLHNRFAGQLMDKLKKLYDAEISMNGQVVLCKGLNDKEHLDRTIRDLLSFYPYMGTLSVVPVGLTRFRQGLYPLKPFKKEDAREVVEQIRRWQAFSMERFGHPFVQAGDEFYLLAEEEIPPEEVYDGYTQLENGVGMLRLLMEEFRAALRDLDAEEEVKKEQELSIATGLLAAPFIRALCDQAQARFPGIKVRVYTIHNHFYGERITVSGLITGGDLISQLARQKLGERLLLPCNMLRSGENVFLDDVTVEEVEQTLQVPVDIVESGGDDLLEAILKSRRNHIR